MLPGSVGSEPSADTWGSSDMWTEQETVFEFVQNKSTPAMEPGP
jgi:hypothetical protein